MIIDNRFLRIGSANLNNRSVGLDSECDVTVIAQTEQDRDMIHRLRSRLLAEHLGVRQAELLSWDPQEKSLSQAIEGLMNGAKSLRPVAVNSGPTRSFPGTFLLDPEDPFPLTRPLHWLWSRLTRSGRKRAKISSEMPRVSRPKQRGTRK